MPLGDGRPTVAERKGDADSAIVIGDAHGPRRRAFPERVGHPIAALKSHREGMTGTASADLVFGNRSGRPLRESKLLRNVLQPAAEKAGLGRVRWHQFRYIHSSPLNDLRVPVKIAQEQLGHASISTTLNIYTHVVDASHRKAAKRSKSGCLARWTVLD
jgi:integrase